MGAGSPDTPQAGNDGQQPRSKSRRTEGSIFPDDTPLSSLLQLATSSTTQAMDESARPVHEQPDLEDTSRAPKQLRMNVITYSEMQADLEPDLSQRAFGEEVINSLEAYDIVGDDDGRLE